MFELMINKQDLLTPLLTVAGAVDKKQSLPILSHILLKLMDNQLSLTATDLDIEITGVTPCHSSEGNGSITVPAKKIIDIIRSLDENTLPTLTYASGVVSIKEGRSQFKLTTLPANDYPNSEDDINEIEFCLTKQELIRLLQSTYFAMSQQDVRVFLNGLLLEIEPQSITAVSMDGHRMALCRLPCQIHHEWHRLLIPRKGIQEILRLLGSIPDEKISLSTGKNHFKLITSQFSFSTKLIEARFPSYAKAIPKNHNKHVLIARDLLKRALSRIIILANEKSRAVLLHIQSGQLTLIANNQEQEEAIESLSAETEGDELKIGINANYLLDVLNYIEDGLIKLSFLNTDSSILVESLQMSIMPMLLCP